MKHLIERMQYQYLTANGMEFPNSLEGDLLKSCYEVFLKEKPPTWEEVRDAWDKVILFKKLDEKTRLSVVQRDSQTVDVEMDWYGNDGLKFRKDKLCIRKNHTIIFKPIRNSEMFEKEEMYAINLTIKYLEAQKHHDL